MRNPLLLLPLMALLAFPPAHAEIKALSWQWLRTIPRLPNHFTQGLVYANDRLYESTGRYNQSRLIAYDASTLQLVSQHFLRADVFAEGLTVLGGKLYQCTWQSRELYVYDLALRPLATLPLQGECWGLATDGQHLVMSDGTAQLRWLDPATAKVLHSKAVTDLAGTPLTRLNELEWVNGSILANVWYRDEVLVIDPATGIARARYDLQALHARLHEVMPVRNGEQVLNGMAWNPATRTLLVTGKDWPVWFELSLAL